MSLNNALNTVRNAIINNFSDFNANNCSIGDEAVFSYAETEVTANGHCCIVEYDGMNDVGGAEFAAATVQWRVLVNAFFRIEDTDYLSALSSARSFVDDFVRIVSTDTSSPSLDGSSLATARVIDAGPMLTYKRGRHFYILIPITVGVMDNIS